MDAMGTGRTAAYRPDGAGPMGLYKPRRPQASPLFRLVADQFRTSQAGRDGYLRLTSEYGGLLRAIRRKLEGQVARGLVPALLDVDAAIPLWRAYRKPPREHPLWVSDARLADLSAEACHSFEAALERILTAQVTQRSTRSRSISKGLITQPRPSKSGWLNIAGERTTTYVASICGVAPSTDDRAPETAAMRSWVMSPSAASLCAPVCSFAHTSPRCRQMVHQSSERLNPDLGGRYVIEREIGRGGMAVVYLADDVRHHRKVAIKLLHGDLLSTAGVARFLREIEIVGRLTHPNIVSLFDSGETAGLPYYVMPFIQGESLRDWLNREPQLPVPVALRVGGVVADALSYAHAHGVIHRDVKPENVLCQGEHVFVTDFGVARALTAAADSRITQAGSVVGSPAYMSPEQVAGEVDIDVRSDVYSLSCVVYEMLAGAPPFAGYTGQALIARRLTVSAPPIRTVRPQVSVAVELALARGLATAPQERWPTATAFAQALTHTTAAPMQEGRRSIGVLPFVNLSSQPDTEYFADGITEDVIAQLSRIRALKVISRTSVMRFKGTALSLREVASSLDVSAILEGSVRRAGDRVRIVAQLIDAASDEHLWAETYDRELTDIFAIQSDVAVHIANALQAELTPVEKARMRRQPTTSITAYQWYLRGRQQLILYTAEGIRRAIADFEQAIVHDSQYALAWASIALGFLELGEAGSLASQEAYQRAREAAARALELDDLLAEALTAQGHLKFVSDFDWAGAEQAFRSALELNPNSADTCDLLGRMLTAIGRHDEALVVQRRAQALDPLAHKSDVATTLLRARRYEEALSVASLAVDVDPENARAQATLGWAYVKLARNAEGLAALERAVELSNGSTLWLAQLGEAYGLVGQREKALEILGTLERVGREGYVSPYHFAYVLTGLGESDRALDWLERAFEERAGAIYGIKASFLFEPLRDHSRFRSLVRRMNLD